MPEKTQALAGLKVRARSLDKVLFFPTNSSWNHAEMALTTSPLIIMKCLLSDEFTVCIQTFIKEYMEKAKRGKC